MKHSFSYEIIYSSRKSIAIQISVDGQVKVRAPKGCPKYAIEDFICQKESWIQKHLASFSQLPAQNKPPLSASERQRYIKIARDIFTWKTAYYAGLMKVTYGRISIREQKTRWGSCSSDGNLNYNWRLIFAPEQVLDYIVVHELAHRREMNHSKAFYSVVESTLPDYKKCQKWLRDNGQSLWNVV